MAVVRETKKLRKVPPSAFPGGDPTQTRIPAKKRLKHERSIIDNWAQLLGEYVAPQKAFYDRGAWHLEDIPVSARETREGIIWDRVGNFQTDIASESQLPGIKRVDRSFFKKTS